MNTEAHSGPVVRALYVGRATGAPMEPRQQIRLLAGSGIEGDRYAGKSGTFRRTGRKASRGLALTLIEEEGIEAVRQEHGIDLEFEITRRNVVTSGVRLEELVGKQFTLGSAVVVGVALNPPCGRLERLAGIRGLKRAMLGRGGIRADVIEGGQVRVGDRLLVEPGARPCPSPPTKALPSCRQGDARRSGQS